MTTKALLKSTLLALCQEALPEIGSFRLEGLLSYSAAPDPTIKTISLFEEGHVSANKTPQFRQEDLSCRMKNLMLDTIKMIFKHTVGHVSDVQGLITLTYGDQVIVVNLKDVTIRNPPDIKHADTRSATVEHTDGHANKEVRGMSGGNKGCVMIMDSPPRPKHQVAEFQQQQQPQQPQQPTDVEVDVKPQLSDLVQTSVGNIQEQPVAAARFVQDQGPGANFAHSALNVPSGQFQPRPQVPENSPHQTSNMAQKGISKYSVHSDVDNQFSVHTYIPVKQNHTVTRPPVTGTVTPESQQHTSQRSVPMVYNEDLCEPPEQVPFQTVCQDFAINSINFQRNPSKVSEIGKNSSHIGNVAVSQQQEHVDSFHGYMGNGQSTRQISYTNQPAPSPVTSVMSACSGISDIRSCPENTHLWGEKEVTMVTANTAVPVQQANNSVSVPPHSQLNDIQDSGGGSGRGDIICISDDDDGDNGDDNNYDDDNSSDNNNDNSYGEVEQEGSQTTESSCQQDEGNTRVADTGALPYATEDSTLPMRQDTEDITQASRDQTAGQDQENTNQGDTQSDKAHNIVITPVRQGSKFVFQCSYCGKSYASKCYADQHIRIHTGEKPYKCCSCGKHFRFVTNFEKHLREIHNKIMYYCRVCTEYYSTQHELRLHMETHENEQQTDDTREQHGLSSNTKRHWRGRRKKYRRRFRYTPNMKTKSVKEEAASENNEKEVADQSHQKIQERVANIYPILYRKGSRLFYRCSHCKKCLTTKQSCLAHIRIHTGTKPFKCKECNKEFRVKQSLTVHMATHHFRKKHIYRCRYCNDHFPSKEKYRVHMEIHENMMQNRFEGAAEESPEGTDYSGDAQISELPVKEETMEDSESLIDQSQSDDEQAPLPRKSSCKIYAMQYRRGDKLYYRCSECKQCLSTKHSCERHIMLHTGERPFQCSVCEKSFIQKRALQKHMEVHRGRQIYRCRHCNADFETEQEIRSHIEEEHDMELASDDDDDSEDDSESTGQSNTSMSSLELNKFKCSYCDSVFRSRHSVLIHTGKMHNKNRMRPKSLP